MELLVGIAFSPLGLILLFSATVTAIRIFWRSRVR